MGCSRMRLESDINPSMYDTARDCKVGQRRDAIASGYVADTVWVVLCSVLEGACSHGQPSKEIWHLRGNVGELCPFLVGRGSGRLHRVCAAWLAAKRCQKNVR